MPQPADTDSTIKLGALTSQNVGLLRVLNKHTFPVAYGDKFYETVVATPALTRMGACQALGSLLTTEGRVQRTCATICSSAR
jgi:hypothetical protein